MNGKIGILIAIFGITCIISSFVISDLSTPPNTPSLFTIRQESPNRACLYFPWAPNSAITEYPKTSAWHVAEWYLASNFTGILSIDGYIICTVNFVDATITTTYWQSTNSELTFYVNNQAVLTFS